MSDWEIIVIMVVFVGAVVFIFGYSIIPLLRMPDGSGPLPEDDPLAPGPEPRSEPVPVSIKMIEIMKDRS